MFSYIKHVGDGHVGGRDFKSGSKKNMSCCKNKSIP